MTRLFASLVAALMMAGSASADIKFANIAELSGAGAVSGNNWRDGVILAIEEINAKGGILGQKIELTNYDTQSNPGVARSQMQRALDGNPYVVLGPI